MVGEPRDRMNKQHHISFEALDQIQSGFAIYTPDFKLVFANKALRGYLPKLYAHLDQGGTLQEGIKTQSRVLFADKSEAEIEVIAAQIFEKIKSGQKMEADTPDGRRLQSSYSQTASGHYILNTTDITDHHLYEEELAKARKEADRANRAKSDFLANMSHEIRTPLSGVFMAAQILRTHLRTFNHPKLSELAEVLVSSSEHLGGVINQILVMSKIEAGQIEISPRPGDLAEMLSLIVKSNRYVAEDKNLQLDFLVDDSVPRSLYFDPLRVRQCVANLLGNAIKFTDTGKVTLAALFEAETSDLVIHVVDSGPGISDQDMDRVFSDFGQVQANAGCPKTGTGLGLSISRNLARLMDGDITVTSELGRGSIFTLRIKCDPMVADQPSLKVA